MVTFKYSHLIASITSGFFVYFFNISGISAQQTSCNSSTIMNIMFSSSPLEVGQVWTKKFESGQEDEMICMEEMYAGKLEQITFQCKEGSWKLISMSNPKSLTCVPGNIIRPGGKKEIFKNQNSTCKIKAKETKLYSGDTLDLYRCVSNMCDVKKYVETIPGNGSTITITTDMMVDLHDKEYIRVSTESGKTGWVPLNDTDCVKHADWMIFKTGNWSKANQTCTALGMKLPSTAELEDAHNRMVGDTWRVANVWTREKSGNQANFMNLFTGEKGKFPLTFPTAFIVCKR